MEDQFLKKNIPGKYSTWDDANDDLRADDDDNGCDNHDCNDEHSHNKNTSQDQQLLEQVRDWDANDIPKPLQHSALKSSVTTSSHNTGVKGVLNDHRAAKDFEMQQLRIEAAEREGILNRISQGSMLKPGETSISAASQKHGRNKDASNDGDNDEEDTFLAQYRSNRLRQLKSDAASNTRTNGISTNAANSAHWPMFGEIKEVDAIEFAELVDETDERVMLVVHMYQDYVRECVLLNHILEILARSMPYARFLRLQASSKFDPIALPVVMIYRNRQLLHNLTKVTDHLASSSRNFTLEDVKSLLETCGVQPPNPDAKGGCESMTSHRQRFLKSAMAEDYDSDDAELEEFCMGFQESAGI